MFTIFFNLLMIVFGKNGRNESWTSRLQQNLLKYKPYDRFYFILINVFFVKSIYVLFYLKYYT